MTTTTVTTRRLDAQTVGLWGFFILALVLALRLLLVPDPGGKLLLARAQRLEGVGMMDQALRQYALLASTHPTSPYAPQALQRQADILTEKARGGESARFQEAIAIYRRLADAYPQNPAAGQALLSIGAIYMVDLNDTEHARTAYEEVLKSYPNNAEYASEATLRLGRVAFTARDGKAAQTWLQKVLQKYSTFPERCAEAQFHLGETYETLFKNKETARNAYEATVKNYPQSVWAGNAKERLGLLMYTEQAPRARRVLISVAANVPGTESNDLDSALLTLLAARGLDISETTLRGWSMEPFFAGLDTSDPGRTVSFPGESWVNTVTNAGLRYSVLSSDEKNALSDLQQELDDGHLSLLYNGAWRLASGYDSQRNQVFLQSGAQQQKIATADLAKSWNRRSSIGGAFSLVSFSAPGEDEKVRPGPVIAGRNAEKGTPAPNGATSGATNAPLPGAQITRVVSPLETPTYVYELKALPEKNAHRRALRQAAEWMKRSQSGGALINAEALRYLANETRRLSLSPAAEAAVEEAAGAAEAAEAPVRADSVDPTATATPTGTATPLPATTPAPAGTPVPLSSGAASLTRARALLAWKGAPLQHWLKARRAAASYLDIASLRLKDNNLRQAADSLRTEISALENAAAALPAADSLAGSDGALSESSRVAFAKAAAEFENARTAEAHAADLIAAAAG